MLAATPRRTLMAGNNNASTALLKMGCDACLALWSSWDERVEIKQTGANQQAALFPPGKPLSNPATQAGPREIKALLV